MILVKGTNYEVPKRKIKIIIKISTYKKYIKHCDNEILKNKSRKFLDCKCIAFMLLISYFFKMFIKRKQKEGKEKKEP